jgi:aryl-alcohol dehydrogenase-like predicted oxidoreductase
MDLAKLTLGTVQLGMQYGITNTKPVPTLEQSIEILKFAYDHGILQFDTASAYGNAEEVLGNFLKSPAVDKSKVTVITKLIPISDASENAAKETSESIERSFKKLQISNLDYLLFHRWQNRKNPKIWDVVKNYKSQIKKIGVSVLDYQEFEEALQDAEVQFIQVPCNILDWRMNNTKINHLIESRTDLVIQARSALLQGILSDTATVAPSIKGLKINEIHTQLDLFVRKYQRLGRVDLCYAYLAGLKWINNIVFGIDSIEQLKSNIELFKQKPLSVDEIGEIRSKFTKENIPEQLLSPYLWNK